MPALMSLNFKHLRSQNENLDHLGALAERLLHLDPNTSIMKLRQFGELLAQESMPPMGLSHGYNETQFQRLLFMKEAGLSCDISNYFHALRMKGNQANHAFAGARSDALSMLRIARRLGTWFHQSFINKNFQARPFIQPLPEDEKAAKIQKKAELLVTLVSSLQDQIKTSEDETERAHLRAMKLKEESKLEKEEASFLQILSKEKSSKARKQLSALMAIAKKTEEDKSAVERQLKALQAKFDALSEDDIEQNIAQAQTAAYSLEMSEAETREMIDIQLCLAGWEADSVHLTHQKGTHPVDGKNIAIAEWPTATGPADYVLFIGLKPVAIVEAKRKSLDVPSALKQAERYSKMFIIDEDQTSPGGPWEEFKIPFLFATNGRPYLAQMKTSSGVWFRDARRNINLSRALSGWITPEGIKHRFESEIDSATEILTEMSLDHMGLRPYQQEAISAVELVLAHGRREILLAMATGTGKTRTCLALMYRLIKARRFRRILFLVDRKVLGEQSLEAFETVNVEGSQPFSKIYNIKGLKDADPGDKTRLHVATVQSLLRRVMELEDGVPPIPIDRYDCIVIDECHRGYNLDKNMSDTDMRFRSERDYISKYRRVVDYFDAVKIGLTATPALHTVQIFGKPVYEYSYRKAVIDGFLIDHDPVIEICTQLSEDGITFKKGDEVWSINSKTKERDLVELEDEVNLNIQHFNHQVMAQGFNQTICEELAKHLDPKRAGKTLIFAVTNSHADIIVDMMKLALVERYGAIADNHIIKITGTVDRPLEQIRHYRNEQLPSIVVTVDLMTTGVNIPKIDTLVFLRRVRSRILFAQMLGRATRLCPDIGKVAFRVFDAVKVYDALNPVSGMKPVVTDPKASFEQLGRELSSASNSKDQAQFRDEFIAKLRRKVSRLDKASLEHLELVADMSPDELILFVHDSPIETVVEWVKTHSAALSALDKATTMGLNVLVSEHTDQVTDVRMITGTPDDYLEAFSAFIKSNVNKISALTVIAQSPRNLTRANIKEAAQILAKEGFTERHLMINWKAKNKVEIAARLVGYIRQAALGTPLIPYSERVDLALIQIIKQHDWTSRQEKLLTRISKQIKLHVVLDSTDLNRGSFQNQGGQKVIDEIFNGKVEEVLGDFKLLIWDLKSNAA